MGKATLGIATLAVRLAVVGVGLVVAMGKATLGIATSDREARTARDSRSRDGKGHFGYCDSPGQTQDRQQTIILSRWERPLWVLRLFILALEQFALVACRDGKGHFGYCDSVQSPRTPIVRRSVAMGKATLGIATFFFETMVVIRILRRDGKGHFGYCDLTWTPPLMTVSSIFVAMGKATLGIATPR